MNEARPVNISHQTGAPFLRKTLSGVLAVQYGALPIVPLPSDDTPSLGFVRDVADILKDSGIYRRDNLIVLPDTSKRRMVQMSPEIFCTWCQNYFMGSKTKYDSNDEPYEVIKDVPTDLAAKTLCSLAFVPKIPEIQKVIPAPMPYFDGENIELTPVGFHEQSGVYTYDL